jgi:tRNA threonylcarbamoyladenosine biosynthesis protein TsaB
MYRFATGGRRRLGGRRFPMRDSVHSELLPSRHPRSGGIVTAVLGFDTATADTAVALVRDGETVAESVRGPDPGSGRPVHAGALLVAIDRAVATGGGWGAIDRIAVGIGPGSFTGLRVGIAAARALARGRELPLVGVGTLAVLADGILALNGGADAPALAVIDARRGQAFGALYGPAGDEVWPPFVAGGEELRERVAGLPSAPVAGGDGSLRFRLQLEGAGAVVADAESPVHRVSARRLCDLGAAAAVTRPDGVQPIYLRRPDAEIWRERQRGGSRG